MRMEILQPKGSLMKSKFSLLSLPYLMFPILHYLKISLFSLNNPNKLKNSFESSSCFSSSPFILKGLSIQSLSFVSKLWSRVYRGLSKPDRVTILKFSRLAIDRSKRSFPSFLALVLSIMPNISFFSIVPPLVTILRMRFWVSSSKERKRHPATMGISIKFLIIPSSLYTSFMISPIIIIIPQYKSKPALVCWSTSWNSFYYSAIIILTNMQERTATDCQLPTVISIKTVLAKVTTEISMRTLTSAIRQYCLQEKKSDRDMLLAFFLNCERGLKRHSQHDWNRAIDKEIKKLVGLEHIATFFKRRCFTRLVQQLQKVDPEVGLEEQIRQELGDMEISEDVHVKTKYFFKWCQYLRERQEVRRLKNKEVEDLKKARLFCQYSLKFQQFLQWKQQTRRAKNDRERAAQITLAASRSLAKSTFEHFREKIDILRIQSQLEEAVREKIQQLSVKSIFKKLKQNQKQEQKKVEVLVRKPNIWLFRFFRYLTHKAHPLQHRSAVLSRRQTQSSYQKLSLDLCWKGLKQQLGETRAKISSIRQISKNNAGCDFVKIQRSRKVLKSSVEALKLFQKATYFKEFIENFATGNQNEQQYSDKIAQIIQRKLQESSKSLLKTLRDKFEAVRKVKGKTDTYLQKISCLKKKASLSRLAEFAGKRQSLLTKSLHASIIVSFNLFKFNCQQYLHHQREVNILKTNLRQQREKHLMRTAVKGWKIYKSVKLNQYQAISTIFETLQMKKQSQAFQQLKRITSLSSKLERLAKKSQYIMLKVSFVTILNRMLSSKMKIKAFYLKQETKLKGMLFSLLTANCAHVAAQKHKISQISLYFSKVRLVRCLKEDLKCKKAQQQVEKIHEKSDKKKLFEVVLNRWAQKAELEAKSQEASQMLAGSRFLDFSSSAREFIQYREAENRLIYKLQKTLVRGVFKMLRRRVQRLKEEKQAFKINAKEIDAKASAVTSLITGKCLLKMIRLNPSSIEEKQTKVMALTFRGFVKQLSLNKRYANLKSELQSVRKVEFLTVLRQQTELSLAKDHLAKKLRVRRQKECLGELMIRAKQEKEQRQDKSQQIQEWLEEKRSWAWKSDLVSKLRGEYERSANSQILGHFLLQRGFQRLITAQLSQRSKQIKQLVALRIYASNLKRRALRGLRLACDQQILKQNRTRTEHHSKLSMQKSMDHVRKKSKLLQTIERYNHSRISRVVR